VSVPDAPSLDLSSAMTLEAWICPAHVAPGWANMVLANDAYYLEAISPNAAPAAGGTFAATPFSGSTPLPVNAWSHLATTYDGTTLRLFVNGAQVASRPQTGLIQGTSLPLTIGGDTVQGQQFFAGRIDEVRVHDRALSAAEIAQDMATSVDPALRDTGGDGVLDSVDDCRFVANGAQTNSDDFPAGDACQCGDADADGRANASDVGAQRNALAGTAAGASAEGSRRCSVAAPGASCDVVDVAVLRRAMAALPPGIAQACPAQFGP